jgi:prefoldin subunit 5
MSQGNQTNPTENFARNQRAIESRKGKQKHSYDSRLDKLEAQMVNLQKQINDINARIKTFYKVAKDKKGNTIVVVNK